MHGQNMNSIPDPSYLNSLCYSKNAYEDYNKATRLLFYHCIYNCFVFLIGAYYALLQIIDFVFEVY